MRKLNWLVVFSWLLSSTPFSAALEFGKLSPSDLSCGEKTCYDVLVVHRTASSDEIKRSYRKVARDWHPDKNTSPDAANMFKLIAKAYSILMDPEKREAHNYYLDHPERFMALFYGYKVVRPAPTNPLVVLIVVLLLIHVGQYFNSKWHNEQATSNLKESNEFKRGVENELWGAYGKKYQKMSTQEQRQARKKAEEDVLQRLGADPPLFRCSELLIVRIIGRIQFHVIWFWNFGVLRQEYGPSQHEYLTRKAFNISENDWKKMSQEDVKSCIKLGLWIPENLKRFQEEQAQMEREARLNSREARLRRKWKKKKYDLNPAAEME